MDFIYHLGGDLCHSPICTPLHVPSAHNLLSLIE